ncbi:uncharacterized protein [Henckelia pumila]|uniref:uncharacterized protein n=1 Tax=Henckelia pumila TaxID=405737 RepID=UPI003C6DF3CE
MTLGNDKSKVLNEETWGNNLSFDSPDCPKAKGQHIPGRRWPLFIDSQRSSVAANHRNFTISGRSTITDDGSERKSKRRSVAADHRNFTISGRSTITDDGSERKSKTAHVDNLNNGVCVYPYKWRCLPREIVFEILFLLSAQVIHDVMRHVYDEWKLMIGTKAFIYNHLWNSTPGIIIIEEN